MRLDGRVHAESCPDNPSRYTLKRVNTMKKAWPTMRSYGIVGSDDMTAWRVPIRFDATHGVQCNPRISVLVSRKSSSHFPKNIS